MDWKLALSTFVAIFLAELGDKTQIATFSLATGETSRLSVLIGASVALVLTTVIAVLLGGAVGRLIDPLWLKRLAGTVFIVLGVLFLCGRA